MRYGLGRALALLAACAAFVAIAGRPAHAVDTTVRPLRVLVVGDSISQGWGGDWTWRHWLAQALQAQQVPVDFVGPYRLPSYGTRYERSTAWDSDHAAISGSVIADHAPRMRSLLDTYVPSLLVVELGYNDLAKGATASSVTSQLQAMLTAARAQRPRMRIVLAEITSTGNRARDLASGEVNAAMASWAPAHGVVMAHNRTGDGTGSLVWDPAADTFDDLHPNATGQTLLAHRFAQAMVRAGVLRSVPAGIYQKRTWAPDARPEVATSTGGVRVTWTSAAAELRTTGVQVSIDGQPRTAWLAPEGAATGVQLSLTRGKHSVQLAVRRDRMVGLPGAAVSVSVP